jgi:uncharacterized protein YndB with AHSA1/START domain
MTDDTSAPDAVRIERTLDAPIELVWQMWTDPDLFAQWYGPPGAFVSVAEMELRVGGRRLVGMQLATPGGTHQMWFTGEHLEVVDNHRLVYTESMADADGNVVAPSAMGMPADHPETTTVTVELEVTEGRTTMVMTHAGIPSDSPGAAGWNMALDKLAALVA